MKKTWFLILVILASQVQSCDMIRRRTVMSIPMLAKIINDETMDEVVKMGLFDGCFTGYSARGNSFYKSMFYFRQNPEMVRNSVYRFAWGRGYGACFPEAVMWTYFQPLGSKFVNTDGLGKVLSPFNTSVTMPFGGDDASKPAVWYFDESVDRGLPGVANYGTNHNFFGAFGSCYLC